VPRLGENPYLKTSAMAAGVIGDSPFFLITYALRLLRVLVLLALWRTILGSESSAAGPMSFASVLTYTVVAEVFADQLNLRTTLNDALWEGTLAIRFLRPMGLVRQLSAEMLGRWVVDFALFSLPLFIVAPLLGVDPRPATLANGALFVVSLGLAVVVGLAMELLAAAFIVALEQPPWIVEYVRTAIAVLLSGSLLPLTYYPWGIGDVFAWLPFASTAWAPLAVYTGNGNTPILLARQLVWVAVLWPLGKLVWNANREKLASHGG
jgi:ABC-2 type transport system permease protein